MTSYGKILNYTLGIFLSWTIVVENNVALVASNNSYKEAIVELKKINAELDHFVYSASHELRSPLTSIMGLISIVEDENDDTPIIEIFQKIRTSISRLDGTIKNIITYSRNSRTSLEISEINLKDMVHSSIEKLRDEACVNIDFFEDISLTTIFPGDAERVRIILSNLIINAIKYSDCSKEEHWIKISALNTPTSVELMVEDNGIGIEEQYFKKIFDMFFKASNLSTGSGLGLYITREMVEKLGGEISVRSKFGEGTCFTVCIPKNTASYLIAA